MSVAFAELTKMIGIHQMKTTAYSPNSNGSLERMQGFFGQQLRALLTRSNHQSWDKYVPQIMFAYRAAVSRSLGDTPYRLMFGRDPILPADLGLSLNDGSDCSPIQV